MRLQLGSRIRARRRQLSLTLREVSEHSGLSVPYLSQVERNQANPTVTSLAGIARALGVSLNVFVPGQEPVAVVTRAGDDHALSVRELPFRIRRLAGRGDALQMEPLLIHVEPYFVSPPTTHLGEEFVYVLRGELRLGLGGEWHLLGAGDSAQHASTTPHAWENPRGTETLLLWVGIPRLW
ncbi:helix-turn-helix domain-containing protein [Deinococcus planocerae]|uniref:helix-turn-helix domain-containing protein n=1 Tax=Deinococcus planocerae TaxID=1737569 RepID=UPI000C7F3832|nr:cupin domain-containing protein [Deinococcus planocerae]